MLHTMERISGCVRRFQTLLALMAAFLSHVTFAADVGNLAAVSFDSHVVVLDENGNLDAFASKGRSVGAAELNALKLPGIVNIGAGSNKLYAATATGLYELDHWGGAWRKTATYAKHGDKLLRIAVVGD